MKNETQQVTPIAVSLIDPGSNDRKHFDANALQDLAASIQQHGLAQPITLRPCGDRYQIVAGERRFRAIRDILKWDTAPCLVRDMDDEQASAIMLAENTGRVDLNPIEEAEAYQARRNEFGWTPARIAEIAGVSEQRVKDRVELLTLVSEAQHLIRFGHFPLGHAKEMAGLDNNRQRIALRIYNEATHMPLSKFKGVVDTLRQQQSQDSLFDLEALLMEQVQADNQPNVTKGRQAKTGAPTRTDLPPVRFRINDNVAQLMDRYIFDLLEQGHADEAAALGNLYNTLIAHNWTAVPADAMLPKVSANDAEADAAPRQRIG
jgi:ParB/RepB/Spo0J family partition protein